MAPIFAIAIAATLVGADKPAPRAEGPVTHPGRYGQAGCGLGAMAFEDQKGYIQIVAATLNATFATQSFAITSGTSNCERIDDAHAALDQETFTQVNYARLSRDAAAGKGETLASYASLMGCNDSARDSFYLAMQQHHGKVFTRDADAEGVVRRTKEIARAEPTLAARCDRI